MDAYEPQTGASRKTVGAIFGGLDNLTNATHLSHQEYNTALAMAAVGEILNKKPLPFPSNEEINDVQDGDSSAGKAARIAVHHSMNHADGKTVDGLTAEILANMKSQCDAQQILKAVDDPEYSATMGNKTRMIADFIKNDPAELADMKYQAAGEFHLMKRENQSNLLGDVAMATLEIAVSDNNFAKQLDNVLYENRQGRTTFTPAEYARAANEGRLQEDATITPSAEHRVPSVSSREAPENEASKQFGSSHQAAARQFGIGG